MNIIIMPRGAGKTFALIQMMKEEPNSMMVCISMKEADRLRRLFPNIKSDRFVTYNEVSSGVLQGKPPNKLFCDNVDLFLQWYLGRPVDTITFDK